MRVRFRSEAASDIEASKAWYDEQRPGLGDEFVQALSRVLNVVTELPNAFPEASPPFRRVLFDRFPYALYYRIDRDVIDVVACLSTHRSPEVWESRRGEA